MRPATVLLLGMVMGCTTRAVAPVGGGLGEDAAAVGAVDGPVIEPAAPARPDLAAMAGEVRVAAATRLGQLELAPSARHGDVLAALGPCTRPTPAQRRQLEQRLTAWVARQRPGWRWLDAGPADDAAGPAPAPAPIEVRPGCVEPGGLVVDVQADLQRGSRRVGHWWVVRVGADTLAAAAPSARVTSPTVIGHAQGCAHVDCMEWSWTERIETLGLVDLDGDGGSEAILARSAYEVGGPPVQRLEVWRRGRPRVVGEVTGRVHLAVRIGPAVELVLAPDVGAPTRRCVDATSRWVACPDDAAARAAQARRAALAALAPAGPELFADRVGLAAALAAAQLDRADVARWLEAARPARLAVVVQRFLAARAPIVAAATEPVDAAGPAAAAMAAASALLADVGAGAGIDVARRRAVLDALVTVGAPADLRAEAEAAPLE